MPTNGDNLREARCGTRLYLRSPASPVECSDAGRWSSALDATRRQVAAPSSGSAAPFHKGGGNGCAAPIVVAPSSAPWCAPGRQPSRPARAARRPLSTAARMAARRLSERRRNGLRVAIVRRSSSARGRARTAAIAPSLGSAAPFRTAAEWGARRLSKRRRNGLRSALQNGGGMGCARPWCGAQLGLGAR